MQEKLKNHRRITEGCVYAIFVMFLFRASLMTDDAPTTDENPMALAVVALW